MIFYDYDGQWYRGMVGAYVFPTFVLQLRKNPETTRKTDPTGDRTRTRYFRGNDVTPGLQRWSLYFLNSWFVGLATEIRPVQLFLYDVFADNKQISLIKAAMQARKVFILLTLVTRNHEFSDQNTK